MQKPAKYNTIPTEKTLTSMNLFSYFISNLSADDIRIHSQTYLYILKRIMEFKMAQLFYSGVIKFPLGRLWVCTYEIEYAPKMVNGQLEYSAPPDWKKTKELWNIDPVAKELKKIVKIPPTTKFTCKFFIYHKNYSLRHAANHQIKRAIRIAFNQKAREGIIPVSYKKLGSDDRFEKKLIQ